MQMGSLASRLALHATKLHELTPCNVYAGKDCSEGQLLYIAH